MEKQNYLAVLAKAAQSVLRAGAAFVVAFLLAAVVAGCASARGQVFHSFEFDVLADSPGITLLDYRYGVGNVPVTAPPAWMRATGPMRQQGGVTGEIPVGESLFVKWRIDATGEVVEQSVDLRNRLPREMTNHKIHFVIKQHELFVYVISPEKRPPDWPKYEPPGWTHRKVYVVYPTSTLDK